jgi:hypothetical protein
MNIAVQPHANGTVRDHVLGSDSLVAYQKQFNTENVIVGAGGQNTSDMHTS